MSKLPKMDLKSLVAIAASAEPEAPEPALPAPPTAKVVTLAAPAVKAAPKAKAKAAAQAPAKVEGQGTLKERAQQMSLYLEPAVHDQLRELAFVERTKIHPLLIEAIDLLFKQRGLKSIKQLTASADKDQRITG